MSKKKRKYRSISGLIDVEDTVSQAAISLDLAGVWAQDNKDAATMAAVGQGWALLSKTVYDVISASEEAAMASLEIADVQGQVEFVNNTGFSPIKDQDD